MSRLCIAAKHLGLDGVLEVEALWQNADTTAFLFHPNPVHGGTMDNKVVSTLYRYARDQKMNVIRYNSRGVGKSSGISTATAAEFADALCVFEWAKSQNTHRFWLGGFSFGGYMACLLADWIQKHNAAELARLFLIAPSIEKNDVSQLQLDTQKIRMIYGNQDELVSVSCMQQFVLQNNIAHTVLDSGHFFHGQLTELKNSIHQLDSL